MKTRFSSLDIACIIKEMQELIGMRVNQIYDIDHKTYLIKFQTSEKKALLLFESGIRIHLTTFDWPKNEQPSGFSMKLRKHLRNKRLEKVQQFGKDRIVDLMFGSGDAAYHVIIELFDKGNVILTDCNLSIVFILRPHNEKDYKFQVRETYPVERNRPGADLNKSTLENSLQNAKDGDLIRKILIPFIDYGPSLVDHVLLLSGFQKGEKVKQVLTLEQIALLKSVINSVMDEINILISTPAKGYVIQKKELKAGGEELFTNIDFQPLLFKQFEKDPFVEYLNFNTAVDEFFSKLGSQKIDMKALHEEKAALRKVEKIRLDQESRVKELDKKQTIDVKKAELIMSNVYKVEAAIKTIRTALAAQMSWSDIEDQVKEACALNDPIASIIKKLKLESNQITLCLTNAYQECNEEPGVLVDVDLGLSAYSNIKKYYSDKKQAFTKQRKTLEVQDKVLKNAEKKVELVLKDIQMNATITKQRTVFWFEKFLWFISSENFMVIGSRDKIQIELIVKRYLRPGDIFVHSDIPGASCFVIKNVGSGICPPKTLNEAGTMAVCFSSAWEVHVLANAWWVHAEQIDKEPSRPDTCYSVKGQKCYLLPAQLAIGFGFMFYLDEESVELHKNERLLKVLDMNDDSVSENKIEECSSDNTNTNQLSEHDKIENEEEAISEESDESDSSDDEKIFDSQKPTDFGSVENSNLGSQGNEEYPLNSEDEETDKDFEVLKKSNDSTGDEIDMLGSSKNSNKKTKNYPDNQKDIKQKSITTETIVPKRGQHGKLKKIRDKYKDQDEDDKIARMAILQSAGSKKESNKKRGKHIKGEKVKKNETHNLGSTKKPAKPHDIPSIPYKENNFKREEPDDQDVPLELNLDMIPRLTGIPHPEDKIIFAMPVVAPYSTLVPYKFRVKMIPGTAKRGKSARQALNIFLNSKDTSESEKAVMKNVNDQTLCRDLPGKMKLSVGQQANKLKHKK